ncbi:hypothetical protein KIPB_005715, partial [Kipferlia bialata]
LPLNGFNSLESALPAALKELVENSVDAGATRISIVIQPPPPQLPLKYPRSLGAILPERQGQCTLAEIPGMAHVAQGAEAQGEEGVDPVDAVQVTVSDNGSGMSEANLKRAMQAFGTSKETDCKGAHQARASAAEAGQTQGDTDADDPPVNDGSVGRFGVGLKFALLFAQLSTGLPASVDTIEIGGHEERERERQEEGDADGNLLGERSEGEGEGEANWRPTRDTRVWHSSYVSFDLQSYETVLIPTGRRNRVSASQSGTTVTATYLTCGRALESVRLYAHSIAMLCRMQGNPIDIQLRCTCKRESLLGAGYTDTLTSGHTPQSIARILPGLIHRHTHHATGGMRTQVTGTGSHGGVMLHVICDMEECAQGGGGEDSVPYLVLMGVGTCPVRHPDPLKPSLVAASDFGAAVPGLSPLFRDRGVLPLPGTDATPSVEGGYLLSGAVTLTDTHRHALQSHSRLRLVSMVVVVSVQAQRATFTSFTKDRLSANLSPAVRRCVSQALASMAAETGGLFRTKIETHTAFMAEVGAPAVAEDIATCLCNVGAERLGRIARETGETGGGGGVWQDTLLTMVATGDRMGIKAMLEGRLRDTLT